MLLGVSYQEVLHTIPRRRKPTTNGLTFLQMASVARKFGIKLKQRETGPEDDESGLLYLERKRDPDAHVVVYFNGSVFDPACGLIYTDVAAYLTIKNWVVVGFIWRE